MESLGALAGGVAHDMNNVLAAILALSSAHLQLQPKDSLVHSAFDTISKAAVRGGKMVRSLLDFARLNSAEAARRHLSVLIVDDDDLVLSSLRMVVEVLGHTTTTAASGEEALALLQGGLKPGVAILDVNMPGLGGKGTLPRLRALCPDLPVLLATGRADEKAQELADRIPGVTLWSKPFSISALEQLLATL
jgi:CheY-like chemotaxis protein